MADISLSVGGRHYDITCRDGDEPRLELLAAMIDAKTQEARRSIPGINEVRQLLFAALFL
ncbi:MAG: cell division protein ZapA, partial [Alphaproteobacteria bacterium]|nr:cell division protein ZapA [Alphaproteobacteria bacterium]